jgi:hypothetical protein
MSKIWSFLFLLLFFWFSGEPISAQKYMTRTGEVKFESNAEVDDDVRAISKTAACVLNAENGEVVFQILIKSFQFKKALMQEHFNENYLESEKYPKSIFKGKIDDFANIDLTKPGSYSVTCSGTLELHGVTEKISEKGELIVNEDGTITLKSYFLIPLATYKIDRPKVVADKIAPEIDVHLNFTLKATK